MEYIEKIAQEELWAGQGRAELWDFSRANLNEESRIETVATVASICYGKPARNHRRLVEKLKTEHAGGPTSAFEFIRDGRHPTIAGSLRNNPCLPTYEAERRLHTPALIRLHGQKIATFRLKAPIFIVRQIMRHRAFSFQELSRRWTDHETVPFEWWRPAKQAGLFDEPYKNPERYYRALLDLGLRPEVARAVLPVGLMTRLWVMGDAEAWRNYFSVRLDTHTQHEHREMARAMRELLKAHQPGFEGIPRRMGPPKKAKAEVLDPLGNRAGSGGPARPSREGRDGNV